MKFCEFKTALQPAPDPLVSVTLTLAIDPVEVAAEVETERPDSVALPEDPIVNVPADMVTSMFVVAANT